MNLDINYYRNYISSSGSPSDRIQDLADRYSDQYNEGITKFDVLILSDRADIIYRDDISYKCLIDYGITNAKQTTLIDKNTKEVWTKHSDGFKVGDFIKLENKVSKEKELYLFVNHQETKEGYDLGILQKTNNTLKFYPPLSNESSVSNELTEIPCIIGKGNLSLDTNKYLSLPADEYIITCPNNLSSKQITENTRFILSKSAYKVEGIDDISMLGLLNIRVKQDLINEDDNLQLGIANYWSHQSIDPEDPPDDGGWL